LSEGAVVSAAGGGLGVDLGKLEVRVPQERSGRFSIEIFERYQRSEKAMFLDSSPLQLNP
jgi:transposase-like protein